MNKNSWKVRIWLWWALKVIKAGYTINFTRPESPEMQGVGFAWDKDTALAMQANYVGPQKPTRATRRALNRAAKKAATKELS